MKTISPKYTVLLVDDERNLVRVLETRLRREGYSTLSAHDSDEALTVLEQHPVSVIVYDVPMAGAPLSESLAAMQALRPELPVVLMSAYGKPEGLQESVTYLDKPFNLEILVSAVANALQVRRPAPQGGSLFAMFAPGQRVRLVIPDGEALCYGNGWVHGESDDTLEVDAPAQSGRTVIPPPNAAVRVTVTGGDAIYSFNTRVYAVAGDRLILSKPDIIERHQRRRAHRVADALPVRLEALRADNHGKPSRVPAGWNSVNISDTGMMVAGEADVPAGSFVAFNLLLPEGGVNVRGEARVVWDAIAPDNRYAMGLEFASLDEAARAALRDYLKAARASAAVAS